MSTLSRFCRRGMMGGLIAFLVATQSIAQAQKISDKDGNAKSEVAIGEAKEGAGFFIPISQAKDCAYDYVRERLYVTTLAQLVVVDMKQRKIIESIDLLGNVQGVDISPKAKFLAIAPAAGQFVYK